MRLLTILTASAMGLILSACPKPPPPSPRADLPPPKPSVRVPEGCLADLSGEWVHATERTYRYDATDDGGTLVMIARRELDGPDAGSQDRLAEIELQRTADGFKGQTRTESFAAGVKCPISFDTEVLECADAGLVLMTAMTAAVDEQCRVAPPTASTPRERQQLVRWVEDAGFTDAGSVDAGVPGDAGVATDAGAPQAPDAGI